ncbi:hypothetical protein KKC88_00705 [Patescibacteria group bacterium]|nr:hypothetical protein [Patescibacteria group bacterium]MBU1673767.1 hypothetical protein [Patescibacteria group bacterium]MBU1964107.1 hypothetical protein [Patescibacteria group bacterium]
MFVVDLDLFLLIVSLVPLFVGLFMDPKTKYSYGMVLASVVPAAFGPLSGLMEVVKTASSDGWGPDMTRMTIVGILGLIVIIASIVVAHTRPQFKFLTRGKEE